MALRCGKVSYSTFAAATWALRNAKPNRAGLIPLRTYRCGKCKAWHLTSKPRRRLRS
jgi:hypothetical protein